jgi:hypothetical protein
MRTSSHLEKAKANDMSHRTSPICHLAPSRLGPTATLAELRSGAFTTFFIIEKSRDGSRRSLAHMFL